MNGGNLWQTERAPQRSNGDLFVGLSGDAANAGAGPISVSNGVTMPGPMSREPCCVEALRDSALSRCSRGTRLADIAWETGIWAERATPFSTEKAINIHTSISPAAASANRAPFCSVLTP